MSFMKYELNVKTKYQLLIKYFNARFSCSIGNLFIDRYISKNATMSFLVSTSSSPHNSDNSPRNWRKYVPLAITYDRTA